MLKRGLEDCERLVGLHLAVGVAVVARKFRSNGGDGCVHAVAAFGLNDEGLERGEGGGERSGENGGRD